MPNKSECKVGADGNKRWYLNGKLHREDINPETGLTCPAIEYTDGNKFWYLNGKLHRKDGPAIEDANGTKYWYLNGKCHREDGPAIEDADGRTYYYINNKYIPQLDNKRIYEKSKLVKYLILL